MFEGRRRGAPRGVCVSLFLCFFRLARSLRPAGVSGRSRTVGGDGVLGKVAATSHSFTHRFVLRAARALSRFTSDLFQFRGPSCTARYATPKARLLKKKRKAVAPVRALLLLPPASSYCAVRFVFVSSRPPRRLAWLVTLGLTCGESLFSFRACSSSSRCMRDRQRRRSTMRF